MKIIILTGKFGMGHMMAACAMKQHIDSCELKADVEVIDWMDYCSPKLAEKYYSFFHFLVCKGNKFYNARYRFLENKKSDQKPELNALFHKCFLRLLEEKKPDAIISTLPICSQLVSRYKEETGSRLPLITCVTDITGHSEWINRNTDYYLVGSRTVTSRFIAKGVAPERIIESGLPVRLEFMQVHARFKIVDRKAPRQLLIMGGGLGMLPKTEDFYRGLTQLPNTAVTVITGKNHDLYEHLRDRYPELHVLGYVQNVSDYMRQADLLITKPGGITTFEAIYGGIPILALNPTLQQELYNAQFIQEMGIGAVIRGNPLQCLDQIEKQLDYEQLDTYRQNIHKLKAQFLSCPLTEVLEMILYKNSTAETSEYQKIFHPIREEYKLNEKISFNL